MKEKQYYIGVDFGYRLSWWKRLLNWFRFKKYSADYSSMVMFERDENDRLIMVDNTSPHHE